MQAGLSSMSTKLRSMCSAVLAPWCMMPFTHSFTLYPHPPTLLLALAPRGLNIPSVHLAAASVPHLH